MQVVKEGKEPEEERVSTVEGRWMMVLQDM